MIRKSIAPLVFIFVVFLFCSKEVMAAVGECDDFAHENNLGFEAIGEAVVQEQLSWNNGPHVDCKPISSERVNCGGKILSGEVVIDQQGNEYLPRWTLVNNWSKSCNQLPNGLYESVRRFQNTAALFDNTLLLTRTTRQLYKLFTPKF